ncbi:MAG: YjbQ family protein [Acidobacteria bacterium]|nr:YjbQ family protein [Acidobacteriota bacterium]
MATFQDKIELRTKGHTDVLDITAEVGRIVTASKVRTGMVNVSGTGSTVAISTLEYEPGCISDLRRALDLIAPANSNYAHNARWGDDNGYAHLRSALMGTAKTFPVCEGRLGIGTWQQIILCDFDDRPRGREVIVTVFGDPQ